MPSSPVRYPHNGNTRYDYDGVSTTGEFEPNFDHLETINQADMHVNYKKQHLPLTIGLIVLVLIVLGVASFCAWYFTRSNYLESEEVLGSLKINAHSLAGSIFTKGANDAQFFQLGETSSGSLTFVRYCTLETERTVVLKDERFRYLCLLYASSTAPHTKPEYRLLIQVDSVVGASNQDDFECYEVRWDFPAKQDVLDCFNVEKGHVYGGGQRSFQKWPSDQQPINLQTIAPDPQSTTGFLSVAIPYWLFTTSVSIMADTRSSVLVSLNSTLNNDKQKQSGLCLGTSAKDLKPGDSTSQVFSYSICVGPNMTHVHQSSLKKYQDTVAPILDENLVYLTQRPVWTTLALGIDEHHNLDQDAVSTFADILEEYELPVSKIIIDPRWENQPGDGIFHKTHFPNPANLFAAIKLKNVKPQLMVHPFISSSSSEYDGLIRNPTTRKYLARDDDAPAGTLANITWWMGSAAMLDFTRNDAVKFAEAQVKKLFDQHELRGCRFLGGSSGWISTSLNQTSSKYRRSFFQRFSDGAAQVCGDDVTLEIAARFSRRLIRVADGPWIPKMSTEENLSQSLKAVIPSALTVGMLGHSVFITSMIGGNPFVTPNGRLDLGTAESRYPSPELYLRWLETVLFFPILEFSIPPYVFPEEGLLRDSNIPVLNLTKALLAVRQTHTPYLLKSAQSAVKTGFPMIRPLWWSFPSDNLTWTCDDQYLVGDSLMVAPIIVMGTKTRRVYLPKGDWTSNAGGKKETGPKWLTVTAQLGELNFYLLTPQPG